MKVVWHQTVSQASQRNALLRLPKHREEGAVILGLIKELESADAPIQDVKDDTGRSGSSSIWHDVVAFKILATIRGV